ncbi:hypothetical protein VPH35_083617 [Triticum aestivum]
MYLLSEPISFVCVLQYISFTKVISSWHLNHLIYLGWHHHWKMFLHDVSSLRINILKALQIRNSSAGDMWPSSNNAVSCEFGIQMNMLIPSKKQLEQNCTKE